MLNVITGTTASTSSGYTFVLLIGMLALMYFLMIRPENKRKKQLNEMRSAITTGDEIVTIGGVMGKVVQTTEDTITIETGEDRVRIQFTKWAISTNVREEKAKAAQQAATQKSGGGFFNRKKAKTGGEENKVDEN